MTARHACKIVRIGDDQKNAAFQALSAYQGVRKALEVPIQLGTGQNIGVGQRLDAELRQDFVQVQALRLSLGWVGRDTPVQLAGDEDGASTD